MNEHEYFARYPKACRQCRGWGVTTLYQSHPYGSTSASEQFTDPCEKCTNYGICARCGEHGLTLEERGDETTGEGPCKFCGWNYDEGAEEEYGGDDE